MEGKTVGRKELTLPFSLYSPMIEMTDGRMSLQGDSTCVVLRERVDFFTMWYSYKSAHGKVTESLIYPSVASGIEIYSDFENLSCLLGYTAFLSGPAAYRKLIINNIGGIAPPAIDCHAFFFHMKNSKHLTFLSSIPTPWILLLAFWNGAGNQKLRGLRDVE